MQTERISLDVNTDITDIVEKVADSVVGVTNLQTVRDFWSTLKRQGKQVQVRVSFIRNKVTKRIS